MLKCQGGKFMVKVCLVGYGGIARTHKAGYKQELEEKGIGKLVAVCDIDPKRFEAKVDINLSADDGSKLDFNTYTDLDEMLEKEQPDIVTLTLPTFLHKEKAIYIMRKGYNVFSEKPMSLCYEDCLEMLEVAKETGKKLMVGQCLHFFPEYAYLKEVIDDCRYGKVRSVAMHRLSGPPIWGWENWYMDTSRSNGCLFDMHIHDVDFARYAFGEPKKVSCISKAGYSDYESAFTTLYYDDFAVNAIGDWSLKGFDFQAYFRVGFEKATLEWKDFKLTVYPVDDKKFEVELPSVNGYGAEVAYFADYIKNGRDCSKNDPVSAAKTIKLAETLRESADKGGAIIDFE